MVPSDKSPVPVLEEAVSEIVVFKTLQSSPEDIISSISCTPDFAKAVITILTDLLEQIENTSTGRTIN